jgi:hypothetical protein
MDFILGEKFYTIANFLFSSGKEKFNEDFNIINNTFDINLLKDINIVYLHTIYKDIFFDKIKDLPNKFIVMTHNSDVNINHIENLPDNVIKWYSQNINCIDDRLESLPIGLENLRWFGDTKQNKIVEKLKSPKRIINLLYMNHNISTNMKERKLPYDILQNKSFVTAERGRNGYGFDNFIDKIYNHKFVLCPEGNGIDTHRTWECLYLNTIPIEKRNINNQFYIDLPICFVNNWDEITEDFLNSEYERINNIEWNYDKLTFSYWKEKILKQVQEYRNNLL